MKKNQKFQWQIKIETRYKTMLVYCSKYRKNTEIKNPKVLRAKNWRIMLLTRCGVCISKKSKYIKEK